MVDAEIVMDRVAIQPIAEVEIELLGFAKSTGLAGIQ